MEAVLLNSGGMDTAVVAALCHAQGWTLRSLHIDYNPHNSARAQQAAQEIADRYCVEHTVFPFPFDWTYQATPSIFLMGGTQYVTMALAISYALKHGLGYVFLGLKTDAYAESYVDKVADICSEHKLITPPIILSPVEHLSNEEVLAKAAELGLNLDFTCSCNHGPLPCGQCPKCQFRSSHGLALN